MGAGATMNDTMKDAMKDTMTDQEQTLTTCFSYPWYDSRWLKNYRLPKQLIANKYPHFLKEFEELLEPLRTRQDFQTKTYQSVFNTSTLQRIRDAIKGIKKADIELHELTDFRRFIVHNLPLLTKLQEELVDLVSAGACEKGAMARKLHPCQRGLAA